MSSDNLTDARRLLVAELADLDTRRQRLQTALAALEPDQPPPPERTTRPTLVPPPKRTPRKPRVVNRPTHDEIAAVIRQAEAEKLRPVKVLAERFAVPVSTAKNWVPKVRKLGLLDEPTANGHPVSNGSPPAWHSAPGEPSPFATAAKVYACTDCDFTTDAAHPGELRTHTMDVHGRRPNADERDPVVSGR
jgi:hypothetical protein